MAQLHWSLIPKCWPQHADEAAALSTERRELSDELRAIGGLAGFFSPRRRARKSAIRARIGEIDTRRRAMLMPVGADLKPPCVGVDERATRFLREQIERAPEAWPLPVEEMLKEMHGQPIWELAGYELLADLDIGWPRGAFAVPVGPELGGDLVLRLARHLGPSEAITLAGEIEGRLRPLLPPPPAPPVGDPQRLHTALVAMTWLRFWGERGYGFQLGSSGG
jgi:hypothetical protein